MDILEFLPFIIAIIIYLVQQALKANKDSSKSSSPMDSDSRGSRPKSFEELLEEIQGNKKSAQRQQEYESYEEYEPEESVQRSRSSREFSGEEESSVVERFRKSVREAENTVKIEDKRSTDLDKGLRFDEFKIKKKKTEGSRYKKMLRNKNSAKDAIILSEILRRKY